MRRSTDDVLVRVGEGRGDETKGRFVRAHTGVAPGVLELAVVVVLAAQPAVPLWRGAAPLPDPLRRLTRGHVLRASTALAAFLVVVAGTTLAAGCGTGGGESPPPGAIVFTRWGSPTGGSGAAGDVPSLYVASLDGTQPRLLVRDADDAAVSPDGRQIAFVREGAIWLMSRSGTGQHQLTSPEQPPQSDEQRVPGLDTTEDSAPAWSPDGKTVYFSRLEWKTTTQTLWSLETVGTGLRQLTTAAAGIGEAFYGASYGNPSPGPDGRLIAVDYTSDWRHARDLHIQVITSEGEAAVLPFALPEAADADALALTLDGAWSPTGRYLAYKVVDPEGLTPGGLFVSAADGSPPRRLAAPKRDVWSPAWSADGKWIAFADVESGAGDIWLVQLDGTELRRVTATTADESDPAWLPAGG